MRGTACVSFYLSVPTPQPTICKRLNYHQEAFGRSLLNVIADVCTPIYSLSNLSLVLKMTGPVRVPEATQCVEAGVVAQAGKSSYCEAEAGGLQAREQPGKDEALPQNK